jgi:hypothetical protein
MIVVMFVHVTVPVLVTVPMVVAVIPPLLSITNPRPIISVAVPVMITVSMTVTMVSIVAVAVVRHVWYNSKRENKIQIFGNYHARR